MAFNANPDAGQLLENVGTFTKLVSGESTMSTGVGTATATGLRVLHGIVGVAQGSTAVGLTVICTATSGNTATLNTVDESGDNSGSAVVMWLAWGIPAA